MRTKGGKDGGVKAVVVLSGGQDSATCLALASKKYGAEHVAAITFRNEDIVRHPLVTKIVKAFDEEENRARNFEDA